LTGAEIFQEKQHELNDKILDCAAQALGVDTLAGLGISASGQPFVDASGKFQGATEGTSIVSDWLSKALPQKLDFRIWTPTMGNFAAKSNIVGRVLGRWLPIIGEAILAGDLVGFVGCLSYNPDLDN
jgi:hypothetical protein